MIIKNAIIYRIAALPATLDQVEQALAKEPFAPCSATQAKSVGWVPPRGEAHGALVDSIGGQWVLRYLVETKTLPGSVVMAKVNEKAARVEQETGSNPGKKERRELREEARLDLLPMAFVRQVATWVWVDPMAGLLFIDTGSQARADEVVSMLVEYLQGLSVSLLGTQTSPQAAMAHWLKEQEPPEGFSIDRECELKSADESKAVVRYARHPLDIDEVQAHIEAGKLPTRLALTWGDRVSFVLTEQLQLRKIRLLDDVFDRSGNDESGFDADVAITTGELARLIPGLVAGLGGEAGGRV